MSERKLALLMTPTRDRYANLLNQLKEIIKSAPVDVVITTADDWKSTHIENLTIEDLKQNERVRGLLETLREIERFWDCEPNSSDLADKKITEWGL